MNALRLFGASIWSRSRTNRVARKILVEKAEEGGYTEQPLARYYSEESTRRERYNRIFFGIQYLGFGYRQIPDRTILVTADKDYNFLQSEAKVDYLSDYVEIKFGNLLIILNTEDGSYTVYLK